MSSKAIVSTMIVIFLLLSVVPFVFSTAADEQELPSSFDQRDLGIVTPPKYQGVWNVCWTFGGIGAAETAILSMLDTTYDEYPLDLSERHVAFFANNYIDESLDPKQAGEGIHMDSDDLNAQFTSGINFFFTQLFSSGIGPLPEKYYPYQGKEGITMLDGFLDPETREEAVLRYYVGHDREWLEDILNGYSPETSARKYKEWAEGGAVWPEDTDPEHITYDDFIYAYAQNGINHFSKENGYSYFDDWSLEMDERNYSVGYTMLDGNYLKDPSVRDDNNHWIDVDWDAVDDMKRELYQGHGMVIAYNPDSRKYNEETGAQFQDEQKYTGHVVQLIGWDDNYSKDNFLNTPEGDGAWLCKNSWGSEVYGWEVNGERYYREYGYKDEDGKSTGFFWLSYYDRSIGYVESLTFTDKLMDPENGMMLYIYDYMQDAYNYGWSRSTPSRMANVFEVEEHDMLEAVSVKTYGNGSSVTVWVYYDIDGNDPESGDLVANIETVIQYSGYHVLMLDDLIELEAGKRFSVVMEERTPEGEYLVCSGIYLDSETNWYKCEAVVNEGESFVYDNGWKDWKDVTEDWRESRPNWYFDNFGLKAYAVPYKEPKEDGPIYGLVIALAISCVLAISIMVRRH